MQQAQSKGCSGIGSQGGALLLLLLLLLKRHTPALTQQQFLAVIG
jgi:hypothetical protein